MKLPIINLLLIAALYSCSPNGNKDFKHTECNGVYYWKTKLELGSPDFAFMNPHKINRIYLRIFDVTAEASDSSSTFERVVRSTHSKRTKREDLTLESMAYHITLGSEARKMSLWKH